MKTLAERISSISFYLQSLTAPNLLPEVQDAVERKDRNLLVKVCRKAKIPEIYLSNVMSVLLSVSPQQKWPAQF
jgi:hypothetical protein